MEQVLLRITLALKQYLWGTLNFKQQSQQSLFPKFLGWLLEPLATQEFNFKWTKHVTQWRMLKKEVIAKLKLLRIKDV